MRRNIIPLSSFLCGLLIFVGVVSYAGSFGDAESHIKAGRFIEGAQILEERAEVERRTQYFFYAGWARLQAGEPLRALRNFRLILLSNDQWSKRANTWIKKTAKVLAANAIKDYQKHKYLDAILKSEAVLGISSIPEELYGSTQVVLGLSLFRIGKTLEGREQIEKGNLKIKDKKTSSLLNDLLRQSEQSNEIQGSVSLKTGYNSNVFGEGYSEDRTGSASTELDLFFKRDWNPISIFADGNYQEQWGFKDLRWFSLRGGSQWSVLISNTLFSSSVSFKYSNLGGKTYLLVPSVTLAFSNRFSTSELNLDYTFSRPIAALEEFSFATGTTHQLSLSYGQMIRPGLPPKLSLFGIIEESGDLKDGAILLPLAHYGIGISAASSFKVGQKNRIDMILSVEHRRYNKKAKPGNEVRNDLEENLRVSWTRGLSPLLNLVTAFDIDLNQSTMGETSVDDKNRLGILLTIGIEANYQETR